MTKLNIVGFSRMKYIIIIVLGIVYGCILLFCKKILNLSSKDMTRLYICSSIAILVVTAIVNLVYNFIYARKINRLIPLLKEGETKQYFEKMTEIKNKVKSKHIRTIAQLNLTPALIENGEYTSAVAILEEIENNMRKFPLGDMVRRLNLCMCYFYLKDYDKAEVLYTNSKSIFEKYRNHEEYKKHFVVLDLFMDICCNDKEDGIVERIKEARGKYTDKNLIGDFDYLDSLIEDKL